jgi:hypothetical protein
LDKNDIENPQELFFDFRLHCNDFEQVFTPEINEWIHRYNMLKNNNVHSYGSLYDELPAKWVDILSLVENNYQKAMKAKNKK